MVVALTALSIRPYLRRFVFPWRCRKTLLGSHQLMLRKKGSELACQMRELVVVFSCRGWIVAALRKSHNSERLHVAQSRGLALAGGARIILQRFGSPAFSPLCHCRICGMTRPHSYSIRRVVGGIRAGQKIGSSNQPDICFCRAGRAFPSTQTRTLVRQLTDCPGIGQPIHPFTPLPQII